MLTSNKPPLKEAYLAHFGVKGMKWGQRKTSGSSSSNGNGDLNITITRQQRITAIAGVGAAATVAILYKSGNLKAASVGTSKLAMEGVKLSAQILSEGGKFVVKSAFKATGFAAKTAWNAASGTVRVGKGLLTKTPVPAPKGALRARVASLLSRRGRR